MPEQRKCPYCKTAIDTEPKGKFKCPSCGNEIHIQKAGAKVILLTKGQRIKLNAERAERAAENKYFHFFDGVPISREYLERERTKFLRLMGDKANLPDLIWHVANGLIKPFFKSGNYIALSSLYRNMAFMLYKEGKNPYDLLYESHRYNLLYYKESNREFGLIVKVMTSGVDTCPSCRELDRKEFTIDEALEKMPLPPKDCTHDGGWCRCTYVYRIPRN